MNSPAVVGPPKQTLGGWGNLWGWGGSKGLMVRVVVRILVVVALLLAAGVAVVWVRSYSVSDRVQVWRGGERWDVFTYRGKLVVQGQRWRIDGRPGGWRVEGWETVEPGRAIRDYMRWGRAYTTWERRWRRVGVEWETFGLPANHRWVWVRVELWAVVGVLCVGPGVWGVAWGMRRWRKRKRAGAGLCRVCGYDLRGSGGRCSECGAARTTNDQCSIDQGMTKFQ